MPISSFYGLQTSLRGLLAQQRAMDTTGHNIANVSTEGYSRQEAVMAAAPALAIPQGAVQGGAGAHIGSGVDIQSYRRVRDSFLDLQFRAQATRLGEEAGRAEGLDRAELALAEPSDDGINRQLSEFWDAWNALANAPEGSSAARQALIEQGKSLAEGFAIADDQFALVGTQAADEYAALTAPGGDIERTGTEIAQLNDMIKVFVSVGDPPNDLMDRRDVLLDKLAKLGQTSVTDNGDGSVDVTFGGPGDPPMIDASGYHAPALTSPGGRLQALKDLSDPGGLIDSYRTELGKVASDLATEVNQVHNTGPPDGRDFFTFAGGRLTVAVTAAQVVTGTSGNSGDNSIALKIAELRDDAPDQNYRSFIARVGTEVSGARRKEVNAQSLTDAVQDRRESVAGVSLDEEMGNLVRFQRAYQASSRAMSTMDEMLDVLINRTGKVGL